MVPSLATLANKSLSIKRLLAANAIWPEYAVRQDMDKWRPSSDKSPPEPPRPVKVILPWLVMLA